MIVKHKNGKIETEQKRKQHCVVLDTNIWRSQLLLKGPLGAALIFAVRSSGGCLGLPEIIYDEIMKQLTKAGEEAVKSVHHGFTTLEKIVGYRSAYEVPNTEQIRQAIKGRFQELAPLLQTIPFTLEHAKAALARVNDEIPPNGPKNQQYKDSAIWEAILELAQSHTVHFVTTDKGFFQDRDPSKGLAAVLRDEVTGRGASVNLYYSDLALCLAALKQETPSIDKDRLGKAIDAAIRPNVVDSAHKRAFQLLEYIGSKIEAFLTEQISVLSLSFELTYSLEDSPGSEGLGRTEASVIAKGDCSYSLDSGEVTDFKMEEEEFIWRDQNMQQHRNRNIYAYAGIIIGGRGAVKYEFREPL